MVPNSMCPQSRAMVRVMARGRSEGIRKMRLALEVELDNDALVSGPHVANAEVVRHAINDSLLARQEMRTGDSGNIYDDNGNTVGRWRVFER